MTGIKTKVDSHYRNNAGIENSLEVLAPGLRNVHAVGKELQYLPEAKQTRGRGGAWCHVSGLSAGGDAEIRFPGF